MSSPRSFSWKKAAFSLLGTVAAFVLLMGVLHMPFGKSLLRRFGGCPVGYASPEETERARLGAVRTLRGTEPSPAQPALGFALEKTTLGELRTFAKQHHLQCDETREGSLFQCTDVPASALGTSWGEGIISDVTFGLRPATKVLVNITSLRSGLSGEQAARGLHVIAGELQQKLGTPTHPLGEADAAYLSSADYATAQLDYAYSDYMAEVTATHLPQKGVVLREHYFSARD